MATKTVVTRVDDLTGEEGDGVDIVDFALDGATYEIDLSEKNASELREALAVYVQNGRRVRRDARGGRARQSRAATTTRSTTPRTREQSKAIRDWAVTQGIDVADRGRIPGEVVEKYDAAHRG